MRSVLEIMQDRYSERRFDPERMVEDNKLEQLIEAARIAPTASNRQAFRLYLLKGQKGQEILSNFNAPVHIIITAVADEAWARKEDSFNASQLDIGIVGTHIVLAAEDIGLKSCMICAFNVEDISKGLKLGSGERPIMAIALGYASESSHPAKKHTERKERDELLHTIS